jgi:Raf kinase inhibitor-like YbhB/YbcL family protein
MKQIAILAVSTVLATSAALAHAADVPALKVKADGIDPDGIISPYYAFCIPAKTGHVKPGPNRSIGLSWLKGPQGTKSYAIIGVDTDVPTVFDDAGKEGKTLPADMKRRNFYHWVLYDIPARTQQIPANTDSVTVSPHGKARLEVPYGKRGVNDYAAYFASNPEHQGVYAGYDGPCPPWNDERVHHYHFRVYALDVSSLDIKDAPTGPQLEEAIHEHILAEGEAVGTYTLNPGLM